MRRWTGHLGALGRVVTLDYDYQVAGRPRPDPQAMLIATHRRSLEAARAGDEPVVLAGKSMGGRIGCHVACEVPVTALIAFGFPLFGQGRRDKPRDAVLRALRTPIAFVQGDRDPLCPLEDLELVRA